MPKPAPAIEEHDRGFWEAANQRRLVVQNCTACMRLQMPPAPSCAACGSTHHLEWKEVRGRGRIEGYCVQHDTRVAALKAEQPFNTAVVELAEHPEIKFFSHLPGVPPAKVPVGAEVELVFQEVEPGQLIPEWQLVR
ncbi:MAG: OB-fold domain-containing protein [Burkholderiales bacterium]|nr:OB-fold domain-containing protein [Burkholderiales bacterium]